MSGHDVLSAVAWIGLTAGIFVVFRRVYARVGHAACNPVLLSVASLVAVLLATHVPAGEFRAATRPVVWLLGPAVVAMAIPIWQRRSLIAQNRTRLVLTIGAGIVAAVGGALLTTPWLGAAMANALSVRAVTAPVALGIASKASLDPVVVIAGVALSGLLGMLAGPAVLRALARAGGDRPEVGVALGCAGHGLGTARAFEVGPTAGAFASVAMGLNAIAYGLLLPTLLSWLG